MVAPPPGGSSINGGVNSRTRAILIRAMQVPRKKVMVVADSTRDSSGALQYALSHAVLEHDELILCHVDNPNNWIHAINLNTFLKVPPNLVTAAVHAMSFDQGNGNGIANLGIDPVKDFLEQIMNECNRVQPKLRVRIERVSLEAGRDKANTILHHSEVLGVDILVIGQRRSLFPKGNLG